jgi:Ca2+-binding EF-hand superfamily protein
MPTASPSSLTRHRPIILTLIGLTTILTGYSLYVHLTAAGDSGTALHRSNAVRRPNARRHLNSRLDSRITHLGEVTVQDAQIPLSPRDLISPHDICDLVRQQRPHATAEELEAAIEHVYSAFLDRLLAYFFRNRAPSPAEAEVIARWVHEQHHITYLDSAAVARAVERHASTQAGAEIAAVDGADSVAATDLSWGSSYDTDGDGVDTEGQTLQRTLYHIAEERARQEGVIHRGITCNGCDSKPIRGIRWHCANCADFDLCSNCEAVNSHIKTHIFYKIRVPAPYLGTAKQEPLYPGKPNMMPSSVQSALKRRLVAETKMEAEEIDALWDQFTCLAGIEWLSDPNNVGWALDRRAFNHAFVPRYTSFVAAPNLIYDRIFAYYDSDKNGLIGFEEWIKGLDGMHTTNGQAKSRIVFNGYDVDGDGYISRKDVLRIFRAYYAIEKEATRNYVAEITEELSVRNALDTIRSSQPLGSAFPPHGLAEHHGDNLQLQEKNEDDFENTEPVLRDDHADVADREDMLRASNTRNVGLEELPRGEQNRAVTDRWARRQFYVDEEEGFDRPEGINDDDEPADDTVDDARGNTEDPEATNDNDTRRRWSRSSSRVRFQDDVDIETRSNASTSSRPFGERWGGYEIPEPEKDLGKEVLYQITQQGFNELINPLFEERENNAMDAYATRNERRQCASQLEQVNERFRTKEFLELHQGICKVGLFRYSKFLVEAFCNAVNKGSTSSDLKGLFYRDNSTNVSREEAWTRLLEIYSSVEKSCLDALEPQPDWTNDEMSLWNTWLCRNQLKDEILTAVLDCAVRSGWIEGVAVQSSHRDPTMPQFRPNALADVIAGETAPTDHAESSRRDEYVLLPSEAYTFYTNDTHVDSDETGPFFACSLHVIDEVATASQETIGQNNFPTPSSLPELVINNDPDGEAQALDPEDRAANIAATRDSTRNPAIHFFHIKTENNTGVLRFTRKAVLHSSDRFLSETGVSNALYRRVRELAMNPESKSHDILLASLELVQQEIRERKGGGLINFEEFYEHLREGEMRFLESWMEWVSI